MSVITISITDQTFDKKSSEVSYILKVLDTLKTELGRGQGNTTSGTIIGVNAAGTSNANLGSWTYSPSGSRA